MPAGGRQRDGFAEITYKPASTADTHSACDIIAKRETNVILAGADQAAAANAPGLRAIWGYVESTRKSRPSPPCRAVGRTCGWPYGGSSATAHTTIDAVRYVLDQHPPATPLPDRWGHRRAEVAT